MCRDLDGVKLLGLHLGGELSEKQHEKPCQTGKWYGRKDFMFFLRWLKAKKKIKESLINPKYFSTAPSPFWLWDPFTELSPRYPTVFSHALKAQSVGNGNQSPFLSFPLSVEVPKVCIVESIQVVQDKNKRIIPDFSLLCVSEFDQSPRLACLHFLRPQPKLSSTMHSVIG